MRDRDGRDVRDEEIVYVQTSKQQCVYVQWRERAIDKVFWLRHDGMTDKTVHISDHEIFWLQRAKT